MSEAVVSASPSLPARLGSFDPSALTPQLCEGGVMHERLRPRLHRFHYPVFFCLLPLHVLAGSGNSVFGIERWRPMSFFNRDHGPRDGSALKPWFERLLQRELPPLAGAATRGVHRLWLQCFPRVLGYVFNPVSFWYAYDEHGELFAILAEVSNTFGEHHNYLLSHPDRRAIRDGDAFECDKRFHVSPFFPVRGRYRFEFRLEKGHPRVRIDYADDQGECLRTAMYGRARPLSAARALSAFVRFPLLTLGVMMRIHWQAALLYFTKKASLFHKPAPPLEETTT